MVNQNLKNANIMIVDDAEANIAVLEGFLMTQGYTNILSVNDPRKVLKLVGIFNPDLILLDLLMPYLNGYEVMEQLKEVIPSSQYLPILVLTADITNEAKERALSSGARDFLNKPLNLVEVGLRIKNLLETRFLYQKLENQNLILDEKVKERTLELQAKNRELIVAKDKAEAGDRLKTAFLQNISHEIRTPLNGILGFGELLTEPELTSEDKDSFFPLLKESTDRLMKTINDYLDISLIVSGNMSIYPKTITVSDILDDLNYHYKNQCNTQGLNLSLQVPINQDELILKTDRDALHKILSHLLDNAVKFTKNGNIRFGYTTAADSVSFFVSDTGRGIKKELTDQIFNIFTQGETGITRSYEGNGLGLSIVKGLVELIGGKLTFETEEQHGSTFSFTLPRNKDSKQNEVSDISTSIKAGQPVFLIAEDDPANCVFLEAILSKFTTNIFIAHNGKEAIEICHKQPEITLVFMDIKMPEMDGIDATRILKSFRQDLPVVALTAYAVNKLERQAIESGCDDYLLKPFSRVALYKLLRKFGIIS